MAQRRADAIAPQAAEEGALGDLRSGQPDGEGRARRAQDRFVRRGGRAGASLLRLAVFEAVDEIRGAGAVQVLTVCDGDLAAPAAATGEPEQQQGAIAQPLERVIAGGDQGGELRLGDRGLLVWALAAFDGRPSASSQQMAHTRCFAGVGRLVRLVRGRQHRHAVNDGAQFVRPGLLLELGRHQLRIEPVGQLPHQASLRAPR